MASGSDESSALGRGGGVDGEAVTVDHDVVMEPTHRRQIPRIRPSALRPRRGVVHLQAIPGDAA